MRLRVYARLLYVDVDYFSQLTSIAQPSLSVLFYTVSLSYGPRFTKYLDAEVNPELEPATSELPADVAGNRLLSWADVSTAERYADTVGLFVKELLTQSQLNELTNVLLSIIGLQFMTYFCAFISTFVSGVL